MNHSPFNTASVPDSTPGIHDKVTYFAQNSDPSPVPNAINMYSKPVAGDPNKYEIFYQYPSGSVQQLTGSASSGGTTTTGGALVYSSSPYPGYVGYQYLGGGLLMKFGFCTLVSPLNYTAFNVNTTININYPVAPNIPAFTSTPFFIVGQPAPSYNGVISYPSNMYQNGITSVSSTTYSIIVTVLAFTEVTQYQNVMWYAIGV